MFLCFMLILLLFSGPVVCGAVVGFMCVFNVVTVAFCCCFLVAVVVAVIFWGISVVSVAMVSAVVGDVITTVTALFYILAIVYISLPP